MFTPLESHAQSYELGFACFYDGYWGSWYNTSNYNIWGNYGGFIVYDSYEHPSNYRFKFQINSYIQPSKDEIKAHWKINNLLFTTELPSTMFLMERLR